MLFTSKVIFAGAIAAMSLAATSAMSAELSGKSVTKGGSKPFCKGSTPITGSLNETAIAITTPLASGGSATAKGKVDNAGAFKVSGGRFTFTGTVKGKRVSGNWKGPSCYGSFTLK